MAPPKTSRDGRTRWCHTSIIPGATPVVDTIGDVNSLGTRSLVYMEIGERCPYMEIGERCPYMEIGERCLYAQAKHWYHLKL